MYLSEYDFIDGESNTYIDSSSSTTTNEFQIFFSVYLYEERHNSEFLSMSAYFQFKYHPGMSCDNNTLLFHNYSDNNGASNKVTPIAKPSSVREVTRPTHLYDRLLAFNHDTTTGGPFRSQDFETKHETTNVKVEVLTRTATNST